MGTPAQSAQHETYYIAETSWGVTPATPAFKTLRTTANSLGTDRAMTISPEMNAKRQKRYGRLGNEDAGGDIGFSHAYGDFDDIIEALLGGTWAADELKQGVIRRSFTIERQFTDIDVPEYWRFPGSEVASIAFSTQEAGGSVFIDCASSWISRQQEIATSLIAGATYADPATNEDPFASFEASISIDGVGTVPLTEFSFTPDNGHERRNVIGSPLTIRPSVKMFNITGSLSAFFEDAALISNFLGESEVPLSINFTDPAGNSQLWEFPRVKLTSGRADASGEDDITTPLTFDAFTDSVEDSAVIVTRTPAP